MNPETFVILYVEHPATSVEFYTLVLGRPPVEQSPTFAMFVLGAGIMLGLWVRSGVSPAATLTGGGAEVAIVLADRAAVDARHQAWHTQGLPVLEAPTALDFGYAFTGADPDGHRVRFFAPAGH